MKDELTPLIEAYRAENRGSSLDARAVRERVLTASWRRRRRRLRRAVWLLPIAAVLVGTGALAASAPARESVARVLAELGWLSPIVPAPQPVERGAPRRPRTPPHAASPTSAVATAASLTPAPSLATTAVAPEAPRAPVTAAIATEPLAATSSPSLAPAHRAAHSRTTLVDASAAASGPATPPEAPSAAASRTNAERRTSAALAADIATYRAAHELHFTRADYAHALSAWDTYLTRFPHGTFTPEARLNRAVCLARLGKATEARATLKTLAESTDAYTSSRARRLLAALPGD